MNERELLFEIARIARSAPALDAALDSIGALFKRELSGKGLSVRVPETEETIGASAAEFFEQTGNLPCRSLYTVALRANGQELGRLLSFFASYESNEPLLERVATFAGEQLGMMIERSRLIQQRKRLRAEIGRIRVNLATRKAVQRAEGILGKRGISPLRARVWLQREALKRGISVMGMANLVFDELAAPAEEPLAIAIGLSA